MMQNEDIRVLEASQLLICRNKNKKTEVTPFCKYMLT